MNAVRAHAAPCTVSPVLSSNNADNSTIIIIIIIMQRLTRHVSVIRMTNRRRGGHVDLRVAVSVIKLFEFLFDVQVANDDVR